MAEISRDIRFDVGIELIVDANLPAQPMLPDVTGYVPSGSHIQEQLAEFLTPSTVESEILNSFQPTLHHRELLTPSGMLAAAQSCRMELETAVANQPGTAEREKLQNLIALLGEKQNLAELLMRLRQLLQQA